MSNLTQGQPPQIYGNTFRNVVLPVKANKQIYQGAMVAQVSGACVTATDSGETGGVVGVAVHDQLGGSSDGSTRIELMTSGEFIFPVGADHAPTDATPYGAILYADTDNTVSTDSATGARPVAGRFVGFEDDGKVRVFIGWLGCVSGTP